MTETTESTELTEATEAINNPPEKLDTTVHRTFPETMSDSIGELAAALANAQGAMTNGAKDKQGYGYKYMELGTLIDIARPALAANGLAVYQSHELVKGKVPSVVTHTMLMHSSGQWIKSSLELPIKAMSNLSAPQLVGIGCTYGRRYSLQSICLVASEEDTDATPKSKK
jgi:hypothetical protein